MKYEDLNEDVKFHVKRLVEFLDCSFTQEEVSRGVIENIVKLCSFEKMKELDVNESGIGAMDIKNKYLFRKAEIEDWVNSLSLPMTEKLSKITEEKLIGSGLSFNTTS